MKRILLAAVLVLGACERPHPPSEGVKVDLGLKLLVPSDTVLLVGTRVEALLKTPVYQKYLANRAIPQIEEFARRTALDPRKDLWELLFVSNGQQGVLLGRGKFSDQLEDPRLEKENLHKSVYKGLTVVGDDRGAVLFVNNSTAALGTTDALHRLVDQRSSSAGPPPAMVTLMKGLLPDAQLWAAYTGGSIKLPFDENSNLANVNRLLASVQSGTVYFDFRDGLKGVAEGTCSTEQGAQQVHDAFKALVGLGRLSVRPGQEDLLPVYDSIQVTQEANRVKVVMDVPERLVEKFVDLWIGRK